MFVFLLPFADIYPAASEKAHSSDSGPIVNQRSFVKYEDINPFYVVPVTSDPPFPQFKGPRNPGVVRIGRQQGMWLAVSELPALSNCPIRRANLVESRSVLLAFSSMPDI